MATLMNCRLTARSAFGSFSRVNTARLCNRQPLQAQRQLLLQPQHATIKLTARPLSSISALRKEQTPDIPSGIPGPRNYTFEEVQSLTKSPSQNRILIDVREPSELLGTGRIPTAKSVPISSAPDAFFMSNEDFETKFGFPRPGEGDEVIFYCKAGVRSRQAALLAGQARPMFGGKIGTYNGSWLDWDSRGGKAEREGE